MENQFSQEYFNRVPNTNQNDINDDDPPCPPPGLDRLVTGQTVSFDDGLNTPTFDRIIPGEGMSPSATARIPATMYNKSFFNDTGPQDFFDSYLHNANVHEDSETANQPPRSKYPNQMYPSANTDHRETFLQQDLPHMSLPPNAFNPVDSKNSNASFHNYQTTSSFNQPMSKPMGNVQYNNVQPQRPVLSAKPDSSTANFFAMPENDQNIGMKEKTSVANSFAIETGKTEPRNDKIPANRMAVEGSCDDAYTKTVQLNQTFSNSGPDQRSIYSPQDSRRMPQTSSFDQVDNKITANASSSHQSLTNMESFPSNVQYSTQSRPFAAKSEISHYSAAGNAQVAGNKEKMINASKEVESKNDDLPPNRMAVEGSCGNVSYVRPVPSSTPNQSPNYEHWYSNNSINSFPDNSHSEDSRQTRDNVYGGGKSSSISAQGMQQQLQTSPNAAHFASAVGTTTGLNVPEVQTTHSKTPSSISNASSTNNELSSYQQNDNFGTDSRRDHSNNADQLDGRNASNTYDIRANSSVIDEETASYSDYEDRSIEKRTVIGYNNNNTIPRRKNEKLTGERKSNNSRKAQKEREPPLEQRMVVGETSSDAPPPSQRTHRTPDDYDGRSRRSKNDQFEERSEKHRKKHQYNDRKDRRKIDSEEDYDYDDDDDELEYKRYDDGRDRYRGSPRMFQKGPRRKPIESFKYRHNDYDSDEYYEDDDYDQYKRRLKYFSRGQMKEPSYHYDSYPRSYASSNSKYRKPVRDYRYDDSFSASSRNSRPSSRSQIKCPDIYEPLNPYRLVHEKKLDERDLRKLLKLWKTDLPGYVIWFQNAFEKDYEIWYREYWEPFKKNQTDRRGSGHSERNSTNNDTFSVNENRSIIGINDNTLFRPVESEASILGESRYTPLKYQGTHTKGVFNSLGQLIMVKGYYPEYDRFAKIEIYQLSPPDDADWREFLKCPGPFIIGETQPDTVRDLLRKRIEESCSSSEKLLYSLIKLITYTGVSDGTSISEILTESYEREYKTESVQKDVGTGQPTHSLSHSEILEKYTNLILQCRKDSALDWALEHECLWGHAMYLASTIVTSRYREVLSKLKANIPDSSPLKTLFQLYSDEIPQAAIACRDEKWGDWRPHLAVILGYCAADNEQHKTAIITMGDSLAARDIFAAHFCYVAAELVFDKHSSTKYSLLGLRNNVNQFETNAPNNVILLTQMYEYAKRRHRKEFTISALLPYKYLLATRLLDYGKVDAALQYLESIAIDVIQESSDQYSELSRNVLELWERFACSDSKTYGSNSTDKAWLRDLKRFVNEKCQTSFDSRPHNEPVNRESNFMSQPLLMVPPKQPALISPVEMPSPQSAPLMFPTSNVGQQSNTLSAGNQHWQGNTFAPTGLIQPTSFPQPAQPPVMNPNEPPTADCQNDASQQANTYSQEDYFNPWDTPQQPSSISMRSNYTNSYFAADAKSRGQSNENQSTSLSAPKTTNKPTTAEETKDDKKSQSVYDKVAAIFKRKNVIVAKLPDDKDMPKYDSDKKLWVYDDNKDDESSSFRTPPPPPAAGFRKYQPNANEQQAGRGNEMPSGPQSMQSGPQTMLMGPQSLQSGPQTISLGGQSIPSGPQSLPSFGDKNMSSGPPLSNSNNAYTLSRGKGMKANYVNILSNNSAKVPNSMPPVTPNAMINPYPDA